MQSLYRRRTDGLSLSSRREDSPFAPAVYTPQMALGVLLMLVLREGMVGCAATSGWCLAWRLLECRRSADSIALTGRPVIVTLP